MMQTLSRLIVALLVTPSLRVPAKAFASDPSTRPAIVVPLWPHGVPNAAPHPTPERDDNTGRVWNVTIPAMLVYLPTHSDHPSMAILHCPGGSYTHLTRLAGADGLVQEFVPRGIAVIALKYRLKPTSTDVERDARTDALRAIQLIRLNAKAWDIDPNRIGMVGASAGANVVLNVISYPPPSEQQPDDPATQQSARPDFVCLLSPWPDAHDITNYPIAKGAPPAFIASARDDHTAPPSFAQSIAVQYDALGLEHEFWLIDHGGHGAFTIGGSGEGAHWASRFLEWLHQIGMNP